MPFNIQAFKDNFLNDGYLQNNRYELIVTPPNSIINYTLNNNNATIQYDIIPKNIK